MIISLMVILSANIIIFIIGEIIRVLIIQVMGGLPLKGD
jgi:hypothetical protein